jgi:hypothetical protein
MVQLCASRANILTSPYTLDVVIMIEKYFDLTCEVSTRPESSSSTEYVGALIRLWHFLFAAELKEFFLDGFFFLILDCEAIGTAATPGLLCQPRVIMKMIVEK